MKIRCFIAMSMLALCGCNHSHQKAYSSFDEYPFFEGKWEEMVYSPSETKFVLWAPTAQEVRVLLYEEGQGGSSYRMIPMEAVNDGMWETVVNENLAGKFYTFNVKIDDVWQGNG